MFSLLFLITALFSTKLLAQPTSEIKSFIEFNINKQRADQALINFAKQSNQTLLFSFELTKAHTTNKIQGYYSIKSALAKLLIGSGLVAEHNQSGTISIKALPDKPQTQTQSLSPAPEKQTEPTPIEKISIIGSRTNRRTYDELPVPVDMLNAKALIDTGHTEVGKMLQTIAPSFNFSTSALSDGTDALKPATLRGLGPDQTLVLINGKRRHQASLIHINSSVGRGTAGTDMNTIPAAAIKRIEVLRDGASAQYGSDAIAGVINIVLNEGDNEGKISGSYGQYSEGDGATTDLNFSKGFSLGGNGFVDITANYHEQTPTNRAGEQGSCQYSQCTWLYDDTWRYGDERELTANRNTFRIGDSDVNQFSVVVNSAYQLDVGELYGFITYSNKSNESAAFFRNNKNPFANPLLQDADATMPAGYLPKIGSDIDDISYNIGYQVDLSDNDNLDLSYTYGKNTIEHSVSDTINASYANHLAWQAKLSPSEIRAQIPRSAMAYSTALSLQTLNLTYQKYYDLFTLSFGGELRRDDYQVNAGDKYAYFDYDSQYGEAFYPVNRDSGTQGFNGLPPESEVDEDRNVFSAYVEGETEFFDRFVINAALRYDNYQGFGGTLNYKLASKWRITNKFSLRGSYSTGFRAPSMQQLYFNSISTQYIDIDPRIRPFPGTVKQQYPVKVGTFRNDSQIAKQLGITELNEEKSKNASLGLVYQPFNNLNISLDYYCIDISDRIVLSKTIGVDHDEQLATLLESNNTAGVQFFLNGVDTETRGVDFITTWEQSLLSGHLTLTLASNYTKTDVVDFYTPPESALIKLPISEVFSEKDISIISKWQPQDRTNISALYQQADWSINLILNRYGEYTIIDGESQTYGAELLTDVRFNYQLTPAFAFNLGANNLFDVYPDKNTIGNAGGGTIVDDNDNILVQSDGVFNYSRRYSPFGFNGAYYYAGLTYSFN